MTMRCWSRWCLRADLCSSCMLTWQWPAGLMTWLMSRPMTNSSDQKQALMSSIDEQRWWEEDDQQWRMMIREEDEQQRLTNNKTDWRDRWCWCDWWNDVTVSFNCKSNLVLLLRLGYLKSFLAGSKKTRQGPGFRVGALCISRCWFHLTVVAGHNNTKDYKVILCCVLQCYSLWWSKCLWYVSDEVKDVYEMIMQMVK